MKIQKLDKDYWLNRIIDKLTGSISTENDFELQSWLAEAEENRLHFDSIKKLWNSLDLANEKEEFNSNRAYQLFKDRVKEEKEVTINNSAKLRQINLKQILRYAAVFIPFVALSYFSYSYYKLLLEVDKAPLLSEVVVPNGSKTRLTLQDGTTVWLNAGSSIQYDSNFGKESRMIKLSGEAYLEVTKNDKCPFIVDAGKLKIKVLGTRFNISAYADNPEIKVALLQGSVEMQTSTDHSLMLKPNDLASFNTSSKETLIKSNSNFTENSIDWTKSRLIFNGESFEQISYTLERSFNVEINIHKEAIKQRRFIGDFVNNETIEQIFNVMSSDGKFGYAIKGNVIDVY